MAARIQVSGAARRGELLQIRIVIAHAMETGYRHDELGRIVRRNVIRALACRYNGVEILRAELSPGIAANPYLEFHAVAEASGEIEFSWVDDAGERGLERHAVSVLP